MKNLIFSFVGKTRDNGKYTKLDVVDIKLTYLRAQEELERVSGYVTFFFEYSGALVQARQSAIRLPILTPKLRNHVLHAETYQLHL